MERARSGKGKPQSGPVKPEESIPPAAPVAQGPVPPMFRRLDWITFGVTTFVVLIAYYFTLAPNVTLEDSGELSIGSYYAGVPHPPGYPVWTIYTWLFTVLVPISNIAWRVALSSAVAGAFACGLLALVVSRGSSMLIESIEELKGVAGRWERALCFVSGVAAGGLLAFNGFMWSQAVIVEVYTLSVLSFMAVLCALFRWIYAPHQLRYLYLTFFLFGLSITNHQTLIVAAMGLEVAIAMAHPKLGRDLFFGNTVLYLAGLAAIGSGALTALDENRPLLIIFNMVGIGSVAAWGWLTYLTRKRLPDWLPLARDVVLVFAWTYVLVLVLIQAQAIIPPARSGKFAFFHLLGVAAVVATSWLGFQWFKRQRLKLSPVFMAIFAYGALYFLILFFTSFSLNHWFNGSVGRFVLHNMLGLTALAIATGYFVRRANAGSEVKIVFGGGFMWLLGAAFYFYMPVASMTNPPLNWGYPRTVDGFWHVITRGQYDKTRPTSDVGTFVDQSLMYYEGAADEFNLVFLLIGLVPFFFLNRMSKRERAWVIGSTAIFLCVSVLLLILLNPGTDKQSRELARVFFTPSHIIIAMLIGYGLTLLGGLIAVRFNEYRHWILWGGAIAAAIELRNTTIIFRDTEFAMLRSAALLGLAIAAVFTVAILLSRSRAPMAVFVALIAIIPVRSFLSNWSDNEQRGHLFGYWFGHDMFTPPFGVYPEMARSAILFGGTDPGRFNPTYMIFGESFIPDSKKLDPDFDRRDVYIITQNALADGTYLEYIRAHYNRSQQKDPPFFSEFFRTPKEVEQGRTNLIARSLLPLDAFFMELGAEIEAERRARGVYPPEEINTPSVEDSQWAFQEYMQDAQHRLQLGQLRPGEEVQVVENRVQVSGQVAVMAINALLTKVIFDENPNHEFYVEESFPLDWMFPHLSPYGIIMKIHREPLPELSEEMLAKDHEFWSLYSERLIGNWIDYNTSVADVCKFVERTYLRRDFDGFTGDRKFVRDQFAQKAFSKLRSAIGNLYTWRLGNAKAGAEQHRLLKEAEFALKQSFAFCPYSPEAVYKYVSLLASVGRMGDAYLIVETALKFDDQNPAFLQLFEQLKRIGPPENRPLTYSTQVTRVEAATEIAPIAATNFPVALERIGAHLQAGRTNDALEIMDLLLATADVDAGTLLGLAQIAAQLGDGNRIAQIIDKLQSMTGRMEEEYQANTNDMPLAFRLISVYLITKQDQKAAQLVDSLVANPEADPSTLLSAAQAYAQLRSPNLESTLERLVAAIPQHPEAWYDLAAVQATLGKTNEAIKSLAQALRLSDQRRAQKNDAADLRSAAAVEQRFTPLQSMAPWKSMMQAQQ